MSTAGIHSKKQREDGERKRSFYETGQRAIVNQSVSSFANPSDGGPARVPSQNLAPGANQFRSEPYGGRKRDHTFPSDLEIEQFQKQR